MAEGGAGMRSSLSADDVGRPSRKPGKISADFLSKFESDPALSGSSSSLQFSKASPKHGSSSDMGSASASLEHLAPAKRPNVRISEPLPHSSNEEMAAGMENDTEGDEKTEKKRKSIWKWGPLKKVRKFFSRKKHSRKAKSCEDLPVASTGFRHIGSQERLEVDESLRYRASSSPIRHEADIHTKSSPVARSRSMPPQSPNTALREAKKRQASSHEEIREERLPQPVSKTFSLPSLHNPGLRSRRDVYTEEAAVSFESDPNASSIEGLQAAHDKIKVAPKKRRPPTRARSRTSSLGVADTPVTQDPNAHKRSRTDPKDLTSVRKDSGNLFNSTSLSDVMNNTIFETSEAGDEEDGLPKTPPQGSQRDKETKDAIRDDVMSRVNNILAQSTGPSRLSTGESTSKPPASEVDLKRTETEAVDLGTQDKGKETLEKKERTLSEKRSFPDKKDEDKEKVVLRKTSKESFEKTDVSVRAKRWSYAEQKSKDSIELKEKSECSTQEKRSSFPKKYSGSSFAHSIQTSRAESEIVMAENTCQLESEVTFDDFEFDKILDNEPTPSEQPAEKTKKESQASTKPKVPEQKETSKPAAPFKRGKSWSANNYQPKLQEVPFKRDNTESGAAKKEGQTNILTEKQEQRKDESKSNASEESVQFRFSRTKSWSYGTKPGDAVKANAKENQKPAVEKEGGNEPTWVASAKRKSKRISQLLQEDETSENQTPTLTTPNKNIINKPLAPKPQTSPKPPPKAAPKAAGKPGFVINKDPVKTVPPKPSEPPAVAKEPVKPATTQKPSKPLVVRKDETKTTQPNPSMLAGRNSATLPARMARDATKTAVDQTNRQSLNLSSRDPNKKPFTAVKIEKCIVCDRTVYQMEKCKFDDSVLHRNCIKCTVCKRNLTMGNFVLAESKIYCKPHSQTVTVST